MKLHINWEALGATAAIACAIHCAILPLVLTSLPLFGVNLLENIFLEAAMLTAALIIGGFSLWHGFKRHHHRLLPLLSFTAGITILVLQHFLKTQQLWLIIISSGLILLAYYMNWKFCRIAKHCHTSDCNH